MGTIIIPTPQEKKPMAPTFQLLANTIRSYEPDRLCENTISSLRFMLKSEVFAPVHDVIEDKILEVAEFFRRRNEEVVKTNLEGRPLNRPKRGPKVDNRKKKKVQANAGNLPGEPALSMEFRIDKNTGLLMPVRK
jgi:hypothetical protein